jgi:adenylyltransferase/sulfurtransferase
MSGSPGTGIGLTDAALAAIYAHAEEGYPEEVCGLVFAARPAEGAAFGYAEPEVLRCENRQNALHTEDPVTFPRDARTAYNLGPRDLMRLDRSLRGDRPARVIYHSHVDVGAYFSEEDERAAAPDGELLYPCDYLVVDVRADGARGCRLFRFAAGRFVEIGAHHR